MDYHRRLVDLLKDLRAARARNDGPAVEAAYAKLAAHAKSLGMLVHFLHGCREEWGANLELDEVVTWLAGEYRSGVRTLCPAAWDHLSTDPVFAELERWLERATEAPTGADTDAAYIPFTKAIELSNGILNRSNLNKAIDDGDPVKVRAKKPSSQRKNVHIQDVLLLTEKLSGNKNAREEAVRMFNEWRALYLKKQSHPDLR